MNELRTIAITHRNFPLQTVGLFHLNAENRSAVLQEIKSKFNIGELFYISTCNRVELIFTLPHYVCPGVSAQILTSLNPSLEENLCKELGAKVDRYNGAEAVQHLLSVAAGMDSAVLGEREIITQLRLAYEEAVQQNLAGDNMRMLVSQCLKTAKDIFTNTDLVKRPVSVVSLAWQQFSSFAIETNARILLVGAGQVIRNFVKFLSENGYTNFTVANRSLENAEALALPFGGRAISLDQLADYNKGFDALITCTASHDAVISHSLYQHLVLRDPGQKLVLDLALPADIDPQIIAQEDVHYINLEDIKRIASENISFRTLALSACEPIIAAGIKDLEKACQERQIERAMQSIPQAIKEIKDTALGHVFAKDLEKLDDTSRQVLEKIMNYIEKKYISIPMKMAREVLLDEVAKN